MKKAGLHILLVLLLASSAACSRGSRVIPERKMTELIADMFIADQWLHDFPQYRSKADTTLFYDAVFRMHGYTFEDYQASLDFYIDHPDKFIKVSQKAADLIGSRREAFSGETQREREVNDILRHAKYKKVEFKAGELQTGYRVLWPSSGNVRDTLVLNNYNVERNNRIRADQKPAPGKLPGYKPVAGKRKDL